MTGAAYYFHDHPLVAFCLMAVLLVFARYLWTRG